MSHKHVIRIEFLLGILCIFAFSVIFVFDCINTAEHQLIEYDEAYNATVAANVARYGVYRVSYPAEIIFYNIISTGETVILPTSLVFKLFGINSTTSSVIAVIYALGCIWAIWILFYRCLRDYFSYSSILSAVGTIALVLSDGLFQYISIHLIGEGAALLFFIIGLIQIKEYYDKRKGRYLFITGALVAASFLTKSSMIFIVVSITGLVIIDALVMKKISLSGLGLYCVGFLFGFVLLESYKFLQLGNLSGYLNWWVTEWQNMLNQSSGIDTSYSILSKINYLGSIFSGCNAYICIAMLAFPIIYWLWDCICLKRDNGYGKSGLRIISFGGISGSSLIVYFILLGGSGLVYARRHEVNQLLVRLFSVFFLLVEIVYIIKKIRKKDWLLAFTGILIASFLFFSTVPLPIVLSNWNAYNSKEEEDSYSANLMYKFLDEIEDLPIDATLYVAGWWQEPDITLYLDRPMRDIYSITDAPEELSDNSFFVVGNFINDVSIQDIEERIGAKLVRYDKSEVDYSLLEESFDRRDFDNFAIYTLTQIVQK